MVLRTGLVTGLAALLVVLMLAGCVQTELVGVGLTGGGAKAADAFLKRAEWGVCKAATVGAVERRYKGRGAVYRAFCRPRGIVFGGPR